MSFECWTNKSVLDEIEIPQQIIDGNKQKRDIRYFCSDAGNKKLDGGKSRIVSKVLGKRHIGSGARLMQWTDRANTHYNRIHNGIVLSRDDREKWWKIVTEI